MRRVAELRLGHFDLAPLLLPFQVSGSSFSFFDFVILFAHNALYFANTFRLFSQNMKIRFLSYNLYLCLALLSLWTGCKTTEEKKRGQDASTIRFHLEVNSDGTERNRGVPIYRENPVWVNVNREPFLTEADVVQAAIVDSIGGFAIRILFDRHGTLVLENVTTGQKGRRAAIQSQFGDARWLAAPLITQRITTGVWVFTPDATREEAERIVRGLNNIAKAVKKGAL